MVDEERMAEAQRLDNPRRNAISDRGTPMRRRAFVSVLAFAMTAVSCSEDAEPSPVCEGGRQVACACHDGFQGVQVCRADGSGWDNCDCADAGPADSGLPKPQGAFNVTFGNAIGTGVTCPAMQPSAQLQVGLVGAAEYSDPAVDGQDGASVSCMVAPQGSGFVASGAIVAKTAQFYLAPTEVGDGMSNQGTVSVAGPNTAGKTYGPEDGTTCDFHVLSAEAGRAWLSFECPHVITGEAAAEQCSLNSGYLVFENCATQTQP